MKMILKLYKWVAISVAVIAAAILVVNPPMMISQREKADESEAKTNARVLGLALFEFETEYGSFPGPETIAAVKGNTGTDLPFGTEASNDYLRQLLAVMGGPRTEGGGVKEQDFYARKAGSPRGTRRVEVDPVLGKGECGFAYLGAGQGSAGDPKRPLLVAPAIPGTDRFDPKVFKGKAVVLRMDNSVVSMDIGKDGKVMLDGVNLLDPLHPVWGGKRVIVAWPE